MAHESVAGFGAALLGHHGLPSALLSEPSSTVVADASRAGNRVAAAYALGEHLVIFSDPACVDRIRAFERADRSPTDALDAWAAFALDVDAEVLGSAIMRVHVGTITTTADDGVVAVDRDNATDVARLRALLDAAGPDAVDDADIDIDDLDPIIRCTEAAPAGALTSYASAYDWEALPGYWDIGVLTHPGHRRQGLALCCVNRLVADLVADGNTPLYRHDVDNVASARVADAAGFAIAANLTAIRFSES